MTYKTDGSSHGDQYFLDNGEEIDWRDELSRLENPRKEAIACYVHKRQTLAIGDGYGRKPMPGTHLIYQDGCWDFAEVQNGIARVKTGLYGIKSGFDHSVPVQYEKAVEITPEIKAIVAEIKDVTDR